MPYKITMEHIKIAQKYLHNSATKKITIKTLNDYLNIDCNLP